MSQIERTHWWFVGRRSIIIRLLRRYAPPNGALLDVGMGTGLNAALFRQLGFAAVGLESSPEAIAIARRTAPHVPVLESDFPSDTVPAHTYQVCTMLDVLEHIEDDGAALASAFRSLSPGGIVLITVPAFRFLWTRHDELAHHVRRYRKAELVEKLRAAGFEPVAVSYYNFFLFPAIALVRLVQKAFGIKKETSDFNATPGFLNAPLALLFGLERFLVARVPLPFGVSLVAVAAKPA